ncbi:hypothetical protein C4J85_3189 [Pseudomonas sp. R4-34-07]|nr:hypothetical protein C4J85_3189 [Pseudomonas sp. R4-34-07]
MVLLPWVVMVFPMRNGASRAEYVVLVGVGSAEEYSAGGDVGRLAQMG